MSDDERYVWMLHDAAADIYGADLTNYRGFACGAEWGAGWMAAIIGMGQAIRESTEGARVERVKAMFDKMDRLGL